MPRVNLLPWREEQRRKRQQRFLLAIGAAVLTGGLCTYAAWFTVQDRLAEQRVRNDRLRVEAAQVERRVQEFERLATRRTDILARMRTIVELQNTRTRAVRLFDELVDILPAGVRLLEVRQDGDRIVLDGLAESSSRVAALMRNIDASRWLRAHRLERVEAVSGGAPGAASGTTSGGTSRTASEGASGGTVGGPPGGTAGGAHFTIAMEQVRDDGGA